ncbi:MAG: hypothetical protein Q9163_003658 [Psora crenata]
MVEAISEDHNGTDETVSKLPLLEDIMQLARLGEIGPIRTLLETGKYSATYKDEEGITPLHWAAINNHYALCKFLLDSGADVNARGGESVATPAMWAVQKCHLYTVHLLLKNGADPNLTDVQGYNMLHLATFDGNVYQLLILLHQNIPIDGPDPSGHTCLMWAAYNGYPACVDLFLHWGASVNVKDAKGFTALHWALVKGNALCIHKLIAFGCDRFAETDEGKTPAIVALEMKSKGPWHRALRELGFNTDGTLKQLPLPYISFIKARVFHNRFFFLCPFVLLIVVFTILSKMVIFVSVPMSIFLAYSLQWAAQQVLLWAPPDMKHLHRTRTCNILPENVCGYMLRDTLTVVLAIWSALQLMWVTMLLFTQLVLVSRAQTTWESMRGNKIHASRASEAITSALTAGSTSMEGAQISGAGLGPNPVATESHRPLGRGEGCLSRWKKLLGLDTFVATASGKAKRQRNPFSRGLVKNCKDFWCDPAPYFRRRANGAAMLDGEVINYTSLYEIPPRMMLRSRDGEAGGQYHSVASEDAV